MDMHGEVRLSRNWQIFFCEASEDAVERHQFQIILVSSDAEVCDAFQRIRDGFIVGNEYFTSRIM